MEPKPIVPRPGVAGPAPRPARRKIEGWKAIAAHLGRSVRTVQRWEKTEGLPVRRLVHDKLGAVWAYDTDLDAWWRERSDRLSTEFDLPDTPTWLRRNRVAAIVVLALAAAAVPVILWLIRSG